MSFVQRHTARIESANTSETPRDVKKSYPQQQNRHLSQPFYCPFQIFDSSRIVSIIDNYASLDIYYSCTS